MTGKDLEPLAPELDENAGALDFSQARAVPDNGWERRPVTVESHLWRHSIESSAMAAAATVLVAAVAPHSVPLWTVTAGAFVLSAVTWWTALAVTRSAAVAGYLLAWGAVITGWLTAARITGVWHTATLAGIILPTVVLAPLGAVAIGHHRDRIRRHAEHQGTDKMQKELIRWQTLFARLGVPGVQVLDIIRHQNGYQVVGRLGKATAGRRVVTFETVSAIGPAIAVHKRLTGDAVAFEKGATDADFILHISTRMGKRETLYLPAENIPATICRPIALGEMDNGRLFELLVREVAVLIIGVRGSGKSNLMNVFIAQLARCEDALIFMIDLKGGRAARPWMLPWMQGLTRRPVIDWLATTRTEADLMLTALLAGIQARSRSGEGDEKIEPTPGVPAVILIMDEVAVAFGHQIKEDGISNTKLAQKGAQYVELGRSEAMDLIGAGLRGNVDIWGSTAVKSQSEVRIGLRATSSADGGSVFPDDSAAARMLARITQPGSGLARVGPELTPPIRFYRIIKDRITDVALWAGNNTSPVPEPRLVTAMGTAYAERWDRQHGQDLLAEWRGQAGIPEPPKDELAAFAEIVAHIADDPEAVEIDPRYRRMRELLIQRGLPGYSVGRLVTMLAAEGKDAPRETLHRWLAKDEKNTLVRRTGSPAHRWVWCAGDEYEPGTPHGHADDDGYGED